MQNGISVFIGAITEEKVKTSDIVSAIRKTPGVKTVYELTGTLDLLVFAQSDSLREINSLVEAVRACPGIKEATTYIVLEATMAD